MKTWKTHGNIYKVEENKIFRVHNIYYRGLNGKETA